MRTGFVGWRGMVGSVLLQRMQEERDFDVLEPRFFTTSNVGGAGPALGARTAMPLASAFDLDALGAQQAIVSCQSGDYTKDIHAKLRARGWDGYWIDAASALRMEPGAVIILDPVNRALIDAALARGARDFIGGNCTVSLMIMALAGLLRDDLIEWMTCMTYQAASGAGASHMRELVAQMGCLHAAAAPRLDDPASPILELDRDVAQAMRAPGFPRSEFEVPLAGSLIAWIDKDLGGGTSREEWKGGAETNKILGRGEGAGSAAIAVESLCVRVGAMRCHSQALTIQLRQDLPLSDIERRIAGAHEWIRLIPNTREATIAGLSPAAITGKLDVAIGRVRKLSTGRGCIAAFTVGDQLLWGAAEPLRRMLRILVAR